MNVTNPSMMYFTPEWWSTGCEDEKVFEKYRQYIESVKSQLPAAAIDFDAQHTLHDSILNELAVDVANQKVRFTFFGWNTKFDTRTTYQLTFAGVSQLTQHFVNEGNLRSELGDIGYWEWEVLQNGTELRLLFASFTMFRLVFSHFEFESSRVES